MIKTINKRIPHKKGAVLLIAILVSSVALAVGFGVYNRTYKELLFASFWKQTQVAFSAADSGLECALYWDINGGIPYCNGTEVSATWTPGSSGSFSVDELSGCVDVVITKSGGVPVVTTIEVRGYNNNLALGPYCSSTIHPRSVERGLKVSY